MVEGFQTVETLTGFKWMGNKGSELQLQGKHVLFAFEEAIGFMFGMQVEFLHTKFRPPSRARLATSFVESIPKVLILPTIRFLDFLHQVSLL